VGEGKGDERAVFVVLIPLSRIDCDATHIAWLSKEVVAVMV
jgi:hypothetical protein